MGGIFAIGLYHRAVRSNIHRPGGEGSERMTITTYGRHDIGDLATERHSVTLGRCNITLVGVDGAGHTVSRTYRYLADVEEAGGIRDERGAQAEVGQG